MNREPSQDETPAETEGRRKLRDGEAIWLYRHPGAFIAATLTTLLALFFFRPLARIAWLREAHQPEVIARDYNLTTISFWLPILLLLLAFTSFMAVLMWRLLVLAHVRLVETELEYTNWCGSLRRIAFSEIIAAGVFTRLTRRGGSQHSVRICQLASGTSVSSIWVHICGAFFGVRLAIASAVLREIRQRCELNELSPTSGRYGTEIWQRPGHETDIPPI